MNYCILNGIKSTLIKGLLIQSLPPISKPLMRTEIEEIDGRDGDVVTKLGYSAYDKAMTIGLFGDFDIDEVIQFFDSEGTVIFSNEPDKFYNYKILDQIDFERLLRFKTATVTFHVQPFKYSAVDDYFRFSIDKIVVRPYEMTKNGVDLVAQNGIISIEGTATANTEFYVPINQMILPVGNYTLKALTDGTGESAVKIRVIGNNPSDADSFGGTSLSLSDSGEASLTASLTEQKTFNYIWISIRKNISLDFDLVVRMIDNSTSSFKVFNRGNTNSRPVLTIHGSGNIVLAINGVELFTIALGTAEYITLDGLEMNAYKGNILMNRSVSGDYSRLVLSAGTNIVEWTGNVERVVVENVSRWI